MIGPHWCRHGAGSVLMAAAVDPGGARVNGQAQEAVSLVTRRAGAPDLVALLGAGGFCSTASIVHLTQVHHWKSHPQGHTRSTGSTTCCLYVSPPVH